MPTISVDTTDGVIQPVNAKTDTSLRIRVLDPAAAAKNITGYAFRATFRLNNGGRVIKNYTTSSGGIALTSSTNGRLTITVDASDLPPAPFGFLELVEYSGGSLAGDPTDRFRFRVPISGGSGESY